MNHEIESGDRIAQVSQRLKALSVTTRLHILVLLRERDLCVGALACRLGLTQGAVSQHLKVLRDAGLVIPERNGYYVHYKVDGRALAQLRRELDETLQQLQTEPVGEDAEDGTVSTRSKRQEEEACVRRKGKAGARRDAM